MGLTWSLPYRNTRPAAAPDDDFYSDQGVIAHKRVKFSPCDSHNMQRLIPGLPDEISYRILARVPRIWYLALKAVSRGWRDAVEGSEVYQIRREVGKTEEWLYLLTKATEEEESLLWHGFDPVSGLWQRLPPMPSVVHKEDEEPPRRGLMAGLLLWCLVNTTVQFVHGITRWLGHKGAGPRRPHLCGFAIGSVEGCLYVLGGFSSNSAMRCVWKYDPRSNSWEETTSMSTARAYCKTGLLNNKLYVVGGVSRGRDGLTPLQSAEVFDPCTGLWDTVPSMPCLKAQGLPAPFLADVLKPIATGMTSYRGKLCVPQSLYSWPFFVDVGGEIYDPETTSWIEMPAGMGEGWPAKQAGTKLSVVVGGELYALEPSSSLDSGKIKVYAPDEDAWKVVIDKVPVLDFTCSECPYLLAGFMGKLHVITRDGRGNMAISQADLPNNESSSSSSSSSLSSSSSSLSSSSSSDMASTSLDSSAGIQLPVQVDKDVWKVIANKHFGVSEFISCQVLDI